MFNPAMKQKGLRRIYLASKNSLKALRWLIKNEAAFKQECFLLLGAIVMSGFVTDSPLEILLLILSVVMILAMEVVNTAIEVIVDRIGLDIHPLSGLAKDLGSLLVLISIMGASLVWLVIMY
jgi:diacylglycerol kinase (ATP)